MLDKCLDTSSSLNKLDELEESVRRLVSWGKPWVKYIIIMHDGNDILCRTIILSMCFGREPT